jgi:hypothetical protein
VKALSTGGFPLVSSILAAVVGFATRSLHIRQEFYAVVAQVLPVFLLVIAVEGRFFRERPHLSAPRRVIIEQLLAVTVVAECFSLVVIARGSDAVPLRGGVLVGLSLVIILFGVLATEGPMADDEGLDR